MNSEAPIDSQTNVNLLNTQQIAEILGVSTQTVDRFRKAGRLRAFKLSGRIVRYSESHLHEFLANGVAESGAR